MGRRRRLGSLLAFLTAGWLVLVGTMAITAHAAGASAPNCWLVPAGMLAALIGGALLAATPEVPAFWDAALWDEKRVRRRTAMSGADVVRVVGWLWLGSVSFRPPRAQAS